MKEISEQEIRELCDIVRETAFALHTYLRFGHLEKVYENGLAYRLRKQGIKVEQQNPLQVTDEDGTVLGNFFADLWVEDCLIVELKACTALSNVHFAQTIGYLRASNVRHGMLINFGSPIIQFKKLVVLAWR